MAKNDRCGETSIGSHVSGCLAKAPHTQSPARPFIPVSNDPDVPEVLTPATLLTQQPQQLKQPAGDFSAENLSHKQ